MESHALSTHRSAACGSVAGPAPARHCDRKLLCPDPNPVPTPHQVRRQRGIAIANSFAIYDNAKGDCGLVKCNPNHNPNPNPNHNPNPNPKPNANANPNPNQVDGVGGGPLLGPGDSFGEALSLPQPPPTPLALP